MYVISYQLKVVHTDEQSTLHFSGPFSEIIHNMKNPYGQVKRMNNTSTCHGQIYFEKSPLYIKK